MLEDLKPPKVARAQQSLEELFQAADAKVLDQK